MYEADETLETETADYPMTELYRKVHILPINGLFFR
jgi:hypothetical protein